MKKHFPNTLTCCNLISGCIATYWAFQSDYQLALLFVVIGAIFDFLTVLQPDCYTYLLLLVRS